MDRKDLEIIECLKEDASRSVREISRKTKIPITTVHHRIKSLKEKGIIEKTTIKLNHEKIGLETSAYILITVFHYLNTGERITQEEIAKKISKIPDVELVDLVTGETDIVVKARVNNMKELNQLVLNKIREIQGVDKTITLTIFNEIKNE